jgi:hypothetical protein
MIQDFYFSFGLIIFLSIFYQIINFNKIYFIFEWFYKFNKIAKKKPQKSDFRKKSDWNIYNKVNILVAFENIWIIGLIFSKYYYFPIIFFSITFIIKSYLIGESRWNLFGKTSTFFSILLKIAICNYILYKEFIEDIISSFL